MDFSAYIPQFASPVTIESIIAYGILFGISIWFRKDIWIAACGGNGKPQPDELLKLTSFYFICSHYIEHQFRGAPFDLDMALVFVSIVGVTKLPDMFNRKQVKNDTTIPTDNDIPRG